MSQSLLPLPTSNHRFSLKHSPVFPAISHWTVAINNATEQEIHELGQFFSHLSDKKSL
jgi:hypothetical protein